MTARSLLGALKTALYRRPRSEWQRLASWGPVAYFRSDVWAREMEHAATSLLSPSHEFVDQEARKIEVWFLTGEKFWFQTAFCAWTLAKHSGRGIVLNVVDDGTLRPQDDDALRRLFPQGRTIWKHAVRERLDDSLPIARFSMLRKRWGDYVNIRKLTDIHLGSRGVKLVLDSDMLFFSKPDALLAWWDLQNKSSGGIATPCVMTDCIESYGYSRALMRELSGADIPSMINVGVCGLHSENIDWEELESWCQILVEREGTSYFLEQALVAMLVSRTTAIVLPRGRYITLPSRSQVALREGTLHHYVADSKPLYFGKAWKLAIE